MKKFLLSLLVLPIFAVGVYSAQLPPRAPTTPETTFNNDSLLGCEPFRVDSSTTPVLIASGSGFVERLCAFTFTGSTSAAGIAVALDSATISGNGVVSSIPAGKAILQPIEALNLNSTVSNAQSTGCNIAENAPGRFENGLVVALSSTTVQAVGCYRKDDGLDATGTQ